MKTGIFHSVWVVLLLFLQVAAADATSLEGAEEKRILIINSYSKQVTWSENIVHGLENEIHETYPEWSVYSGNLKTETAVYSTAATLTLRSLLWGYAERTRTSIDATSLAITSIFVQDDLPDAIVWIGEEGFLHYITFISQLKKWRSIPMVLCAVRDSVSAHGWFPERQFRFDRKYGAQDYTTVSKYLYRDYPYVETYKKDTDVEYTLTTLNGKPAYRFLYKLNYSGCVAKPPVRQNLELIHRLLPDLRELIWVDDDSYRSMLTCKDVESAVGQIMPGVKFLKMVDDNMNTDSIYDVMLEPAPHRAFLTYSWNIDALYSKRSDKKIDSLFTHVSTVPLFTLTERDFSKDNYWVGGYYLEGRDAVTSSLRMLERAVRGDSLHALPFDTISVPRTILNKTALERYGLARAASDLENVSYVHIPPSFFQKYEKLLLVTLLLLVMAVCYAVIYWWHHKYNRQIRADFARYKRLYDKLQMIYDHSSIDFALYDGQGKRLLHLASEDAEAANKSCGPFSENIFESACLSESQKEQIRLRRTMNCEVALDNEGRPLRTNLAEHAVYQLIVKPLDNPGSASSCFMAIAINLTSAARERREKQRYEDLLRFASDYSQVGVVFYNVDTAEGMASDSWCRNMQETFVSGTFPAYAQVAEEDRKALTDYRKAIQAGEAREPLCRDIQVTDEEGRMHWIRQHMYFLRSSGRVIELSLDIDEQKQNEKNLEEAKHRAEESNEETRRFLSSISHEVRTPLNSIVGFSAILALTDEDSGNEYAPIILRNTRLLDALITNILDLSALDGGKVSFCYMQFDVVDIFFEMEKYILNNLFGRSLEVIRELPDSEADRLITTDREYLCVLLWNLVSNAVKFTPSGSITLGYRKEPDGRFNFRITDTGCGIAPEDQKSIFNRFVKLDTYSQGTGLGLALCKSIVKHLGGDIGVFSEKGKGSTFWFVLPASPVI